MKRELKTVQQTTWLTPTLSNKLERLAKKLDMKRSEYLCFLVEKAPSLPNKGYKK